MKGRESVQSSPVYQSKMYLLVEIVVSASTDIMRTHKIYLIVDFIIEKSSSSLVTIANNLEKIISIILIITLGKGLKG
jgi:hypothetical protein